MELIELMFPLLSFEFTGDTLIQNCGCAGYGHALVARSSPWLLLELVLDLVQSDRNALYAGTQNVPIRIT